jgi:hypothetical protein
MRTRDFRHQVFKPNNPPAFFDKDINPNPPCLGIYKAFFVKMKISPGWLKQNI